MLIDSYPEILSSQRVVIGNWNARAATYHAHGCHLINPLYRPWAWSLPGSHAPAA